MTEDNKRNVRIFYYATADGNSPSDCTWMVPGTFNPDEDTPSFENWHGVVNKGTHIWVEEEVK